MNARMIVVPLILLATVTHADADPLQAFHDRKPRPTCKEWRKAITLTRKQIRAANAGGKAVNLKLVELSVTMMDFCANELEARLEQARKTIAAGLSERTSDAQGSLRVYAAMVALYRDALTSSQPATTLAPWKWFAEVANSAAHALPVNVDRAFGKGALDRYAAIVKKPAQARTPEEAQLYAKLHALLEPQ